MVNVLGENRNLVSVVGNSGKCGVGGTCFMWLERNIYQCSSGTLVNVVGEKRTLVSVVRNGGQRQNIGQYVRILVNVVGKKIGKSGGRNINHCCRGEPWSM